MNSGGKRGIAFHVVVENRYCCCPFAQEEYDLVDENGTEKRAVRRRKKW